MQTSIKSLVCFNYSINIRKCKEIMRYATCTHTHHNTHTHTHTHYTENFIVKLNVLGDCSISADHSIIALILFL